MKFEIKGNVVLKVEGTIEAESEISAWAKAEELISEYNSNGPLKIVDTEDSEIWAVDKIEDVF